MRILLTGVTGQVGGALCDVLPSFGRVIMAGRGEFDLAQPAQIRSVLDRMVPELIVNPAAYTAVDRAEDEPDLAFRVNAGAPGAIAAWAAIRQVPLIHFSTDYVFDGSGERPWREDDRTAPLSIYGASKLAGEEAVRAAGGPHLVIRTSWVYAAKGTNFMRTVARLARERSELRIVADQFGAPTSARTIAEAVADMVRPGDRALAERFVAAGGIVNLSASGETSWHGFATAIVEGLRAREVALAVERVVPIGTEDYQTKAKRPANSRFDLTRLRQRFGIETAKWDIALQYELDRLAKELRS